MTFRESLNLSSGFTKNQINAKSKIYISDLNPFKIGTVEMQAHAFVPPQLFLAQSASEAGLTEGVYVLFLEGWYTSPSTAPPYESHVGQVGQR